MTAAVTERAASVTPPSSALAVSGTGRDVSCYALVHFFSCCNIYKLERLGDDLAKESSAISPFQHLQTRATWQAALPTHHQLLTPGCPQPHLSSCSRSTFHPLPSSSSVQGLSIFFFLGFPPTHYLGVLKGCIYTHSQTQHTAFPRTDTSSPLQTPT